MTRKGQSAMEYLMTYGWAILVIIIVIAVLFYIGVLNPRNVTPSTCTFPPGLTCASFKLGDGDGILELKIGQATGRSIVVYGFKCTQNVSTQANNTITNVSIGPGESAWVNGPLSPNSIKCTDLTNTNLTATTSALGESFKGKIWIWYNETDTGMTRTAVGDLAAKFEQ